MLGNGRISVAFSPLALAALLMLGVSGARAAAQEPTHAKSPAPEALALTDANIAAIVVTANTADVKNGELALSKSSNDEVRAFAQTMVNDHRAVNDQAVALVTKLEVEPQESSTSRALAANTDAARTSLASKSGMEFDRAYVANEVAYHQSVLDTLDKVLIPGARNAELKALLTAVRPAFVAHLEHARHLQTSLGS